MIQGSQLGTVVIIRASHHWDPQVQFLGLYNGIGWCQSDWFSSLCKTVHAKICVIEHIIGNPELYDPTDTCWLTVGQHITNTCICKTNWSQFSQEEQNVVRHGIFIFMLPSPVTPVSRPTVRIIKFRITLKSIISQKKIIITWLLHSWRSLWLLLVKD